MIAAASHDAEPTDKPPARRINSATTAANARDDWHVALHVVKERSAGLVREHQGLNGACPSGRPPKRLLPSAQGLGAAAAAARLAPGPALDQFCTEVKCLVTNPAGHRPWRTPGRGIVAFAAPGPLNVLRETGRIIDRHAVVSNRRIV